MLKTRFKSVQTSNLKKILVFLVFFVFISEAFASQTFRTIKSGLWSDPTIWEAKGQEPYPGTFDNVIISPGHVITLNINTSITRNFTIEAGGTLRGDGTGKIMTIGKDNIDADFTNHGTIEFSGVNWAVIMLQYKSIWSGNGTYNLTSIDLNKSLMEFMPGSVMTLNFSGATPIQIDSVNGLTRKTLTGGRIVSLPGIHFNFNGTVPQYLPKNIPFIDLKSWITITSPIIYGSISINNPAGVYLNSNITTGNLLGNLTVATGILHTNNYIITGKAGSTLSVLDGAVLNLSGIISVPFPIGFSTVNLNLQSTVNYSASAFQEIIPAKYGKLIISGNKTADVVIGGSPISLLPTLQAECQQLTVESTVSFSLNQNLTVHETAVLQGILNVGASTLTLNGGPIQGNPANLITNNSSSLVLGGSATGITVPAGVSALKRLILNNSSATGVNLLGPLTIHGKIGFNQGKLHLNLNNLTVLHTDSIIGADNTKYIVTNNNPEAGGFLVAPIKNNNLAHRFPVGTATSYAPAILKLSTASTPDNFKVRVFDNVYANGTSGAVLTKYVVNKTWLIEESVVGGSEAGIKLGWLEQDQATGFNPANSGTSHYTNGKWVHTTTWASSVLGGGCHWQERSGFTSFSPFTVVDKNLVDVVANLKVYLQGPYNTTTGLMNTTLNSLGYLPLNHPYSGAPWNYAGTESVTSGFFAANPTIVDWVLLEFRTGTSASTTIKKQAAFLKNNGEIVALDGGSLPVLKDVESGSYYVVVRHRNHIAAMSASKIDISSASVLYDFTINVSKAYGQASMITFANGKSAMIAGDANGDGSIKYSGSLNDRSSLLLIIGARNLSNIVSGYHIQDLNLDGFIKYSGTANDRSFLVNTVGARNLSNILNTKVPN